MRNEYFLTDVYVSDFYHDAIMIADIDKESRKYAAAFYVVQVCGI